MHLDMRKLTISSNHPKLMGETGAEPWKPTVWCRTGFTVFLLCEFPVAFRRVVLPSLAQSAGNGRRQHVFGHITADTVSESQMSSPEAVSKTVNGGPIRFY